MSDTSALENLKYAHACDVALDITSQEVHELWAEIETRDKRVAELEADNNRLKCSNDTQTQTIVYGKEDSEVQDVSIL